MILIDYIYACDGCHTTAVMEVEGGLGHRPPDPLSQLPRSWTTEDQLTFCPACGNRARGGEEDGPPAASAPKLEEVVLC